VQLGLFVFLPAGSKRALMDNIDHWRRRAQQMRDLARREQDEKMRRIMLAVVLDYELLAQRAKQRLGQTEN
jgi:hypothetical protein